MLGITSNNIMMERGPHNTGLMYRYHKSLYIYGRLKFVRHFNKIKNLLKMKLINTY